MRINAGKGSIKAAIGAVLLLSLAISADAEVKRFAAPRNMDEVQKMMRHTWNREVVPAGASVETLTRLEARGQVVLMEDNPSPGIPWIITAGTLSDASPATCYKVITDFDHYAGVIPMTKKAHATALPLANSYEVNYSLEVLFSWITMDYSVYHYHRPPYRTDWALGSGEFDINSGFYQLVPTDGGKRTIFFYNVYTVPSQTTIKNLYRNEPALELMTNVATAAMVSKAVKAETERKEPKKLPPLREKSPVEDIYLSDLNTVVKMAGRGKILVLEPGPTVYATAATIVNASPDVCMKVLVDYNSYPKFIPGMKVTKVLGKGKKGGTMVHSEFNITLWKLDLGENVDREYVQAADRITWSITRSTGAPAVGFWRLVPMEGGKRTLLIHGNTVDFRGMGIIARTTLKAEANLENGLTGALETTIINAFRKRMESGAVK